MKAGRHWSKEEEEALLRIAADFISDEGWLVGLEEIAERLGTGRSPAAIKSRFFVIKKKSQLFDAFFSQSNRFKKTSDPWVLDDFNKLADSVERHFADVQNHRYYLAWRKIAREMDRSPASCKKKWQILKATERESWPNILDEKFHLASKKAKGLIQMPEFSKSEQREAANPVDRALFALRHANREVRIGEHGGVKFYYLDGQRVGLGRILEEARHVQAD